MLAKAFFLLIAVSCIVGYGHSFQLNMKLSPLQSKVSVGSCGRASGHLNYPAATLGRATNIRNRHVGYPLRMSAVLESEKSAVSAPVNNIKYHTLEEANQIETELIEEAGFSLPVFIEFAGRSLADAIYDAYPPERIAKNKIVIVCGKGNNGGNGLVAARQLHFLGYDIEVVYPERAMKEPFTGLVKQLKALDVRVNMGMPGTANRIGLIVDAISLDGPLKSPWELMMKQLNSPDYFGGIPILSVDVPLGWDVEKGPPKDGSPFVSPDILVSLIVPKLCSTRYDGVHYLGGRLIPSRMQFKNKLNLPKFEGQKSITLMPPPPPPPVEEEEVSEPVASEALAAQGQAGAAAETAAPLVNPLLGLNAMVSSIPEPAAAAVPSAPAAAAAAAAVPLQVVPGSFEADPQIKQAIDAATQQVLALLQEKQEGWPTEVRKVLSPRLVPLGWSSNYPPDRTTVAKLCFVTAKALQQSGADNLDVLAEGRALAEAAFQENGEVRAAAIARGVGLQQ